MMKNLAHLVECKSPKEKIRVFDWVDIPHDEGGCQFFHLVEFDDALGPVEVIPSL